MLIKMTLIVMVMMMMMKMIIIIIMIMTLLKNNDVDVYKNDDKDKNDKDNNGILLYLSNTIVLILLRHSIFFLSRCRNNVWLVPGHSLKSLPEWRGKL